MRLLKLIGLQTLLRFLCFRGCKGLGTSRACYCPKDSCAVDLLGFGFDFSVTFLTFSRGRLYHSRFFRGLFWLGRLQAWILLLLLKVLYFFGTFELVAWTMIVKHFHRCFEVAESLGVDSANLLVTYLLTHDYPVQIISSRIFCNSK